MKITKVLTDNGSQFTDRFTAKGSPLAPHAFYKRCADLGLEHRLSPPGIYQTNSMVERFGSRVAGSWRRRASSRRPVGRP